MTLNAPANRPSSSPRSTRTCREEADEQHGSDSEHLASQEESRRSEDFLAWKLDHDGPGGPAHCARGRKYFAQNRSLVLNHAGGGALQVEGRRWWGDASRQVRPQVPRGVRHIEPGAGADQLIELPPPARRARQVAPLDEIPQDAAALLDRRRHGVSQRIA